MSPVPTPPDGKSAEDAPSAGPAPRGAAPGTGPPGPGGTPPSIAPPGPGTVAAPGHPSRSSRFASRDLTTGSVPKNLALLAWPQVGETILNVIDQMVDLVWAGRLPGGFRTLAGVGIGQTFTQFTNMSRQGLDQAMRAMVSRAVGMGNLPLANHVALQAFTLSMIYSLLMVLVGLLLTDVLLKAIGASEAVKAETSMYMRIQFIGSATMAFRMMSGAALQSSGQVMVPLMATLVTRVLHITLTPFLMFGWWWFPTLGLPGAALVNVLAQIAGCAINAFVLFKGYSRLHLTLRGYRVDYSMLWQIIKVGAPASIASTERALAQLILLRLVAPFGDVSMAAYALTRRMEMFINFSAMGLGQASGIMVGQNLGAGHPARARSAVRWALLYVTALGLFVVTLVMIFSHEIATFFTQQPDVVELTSVWLRIQAIAGLFMGASMVFQQSFNTAGDTLAPLAVTLLAVWGVELPVAWALSFPMNVGPLGIGYAAIVGMMVRLLCYFPYFLRGRWMRVRVI